jgi:hypothetical protein
MEMSRSQVASFVGSDVLGSEEVQDLLMINRSRLSAMVKADKIKPIKELKRESLFWLPDVLALRSELLKDTRTNLYKSSQEVLQNA